MVEISYYDLQEIKNKLHIDKTNQDVYLGDLGREADEYIRLQVSLHATSPVAVGTDKELKALANKHAAAEYLMWNSPTHPRGLYDSARKDIQDYIMTNYGKKNPNGVSGQSFRKTSSSPTGFEA